MTSLQAIGLYVCWALARTLGRDARAVYRWARP